MKEESFIILFDGVCNLCNSTVNTIIDLDKRNVFRFAALQSEKGQEILEKYGLERVNFDSVVLVKENQVYAKSNAVLEICREFSRPISFLYNLRIIPVYIRDLLYDFIAKNRYRIFGKKETCRIPTPELKSKFL